MFCKEEQILNLKDISNKLRIETIKTSHFSGIPHLGSCLSCVEILVFLYWSELKVDPNNPFLINRDRFVLSKGHGLQFYFRC